MSAIFRLIRKPENMLRTPDSMWPRAHVAQAFAPGAQRRTLARAGASLLLASIAGLAGCFGGGGAHNGTGANNQLIDLNGEMTVDNQAAGPNLNFTDGTNATLHVLISNIGDKPSDQMITIIVGALPSGLSYVSSSVATGNWTCSNSGQTITCTSSDSIPGLSGAIHILDIVVKVAATAGGNAQMPFSISTPDGQPATFSLPKGVAFAAATPNISSLSPTSGTGGTAVTISGSNFGSSQGSSTVTFNGKKATTITSWSSTSIVADIPSGTPEGAGPVVVTVNSVASNAVTFTVTGPQITSLNPTSGAIGTAVTISGAHFGASQGSSTITFNGTNATTITNWSDTSIVANVPSLATTGNVVVTVAGITSPGSSSTIFTVTGASGCASGGNAATLLTGDYAFGGQGFAGGNRFTTLIGRFHADGVNTITHGQLNENKIGGGATSGNGVAFTGCFTLNTPAGASGVALGNLALVNTSASLAMNLSIAVRTNGNGNFITYDATSSQLYGAFEKQCPNATNGACPAFSNSNVSGDYGFWLDGIIPGNPTSNFGVAGQLTATSGKATGVVDISSYAGVIASNDAIGVSGGVTDTANGLAQEDVNVTYNSGGASGQAVTLIMDCYLANVNTSGVADTLFCMSGYAASQSPLMPLLSGRFVKQNTPAGGWTTANLAPASNASVVWSTGINGSGNARVDLGQLTYNTTANPPTVNISQDQNHGGSYSFQQGAGNISIASNGRLQLTSGGTLTSVCYMLNPGDGICVNEANNAAVARFVPQVALPSGGFTTTRFNNSFAFGTIEPATGGVSDIDGVLTATGATGTLSGPQDVNTTAGPVLVTFAASYSIMSAADGAIGRYTVVETTPGNDTLILYMIDADTAVAVSTASTEPAVWYLKH